MASQAPVRLRPWVRSVLRLCGYALTTIIALAVLYAIAAWIGSSIERNPNWEEPASGITIMIESNGIHTGIVMPVVNDVKDWRTTFPSAGQPRHDGRMPTHIAVGWGEKEVFLNTPTWSDLRIRTALRILLIGGDGLLRVGHYVNPRAGEDYRWVTLRPTEYARLAQWVEASLPPLADGQLRPSYQSYEKGAANFDATGRYSAFNTCNQWTSDGLAYAGVKIGSWTPLAGGVMKWIPAQSGS